MLKCAARKKSNFPEKKTVRVVLAYCSAFARLWPESPDLENCGVY
jgi:hypothetical protein